MSRSERAKELERRDLEKTAESQALAEQAKTIVLQTAGALIDAARENPNLEIEEENTAVRRLADLTGRSGTRAAVTPEPSITPVPDTLPKHPPVIDVLADPYPASPTLPSLPTVTAIVGESTGPITLRPVQIDAAARTERVLVVEDDKSIADQLAEILRDEGYSVRTAEDGLAALTKILKDRPPPDVIILDMGLPYLSGDGVRAALLTTHLAALPILWISAADPSQLSLSKQSDFVFVRKPIQLAELLAKVRERIGEWRARMGP